jgi:hypothetical protein
MSDSCLKDHEIGFRAVSELCKTDLYTVELSLVCEYSIKYWIEMVIASFKAVNNIFQISNQNCILKLYLKKRLDLEYRDYFSPKKKTRCRVPLI